MPPFWLFTPLCLVIFMFQGLGMYHLWQKYSLRQLRFVITLFFVQIILNLGWLFLFFGAKMPVAATIEGLLAVPVLLFLIYEVYETDKKSALYFILSVVCITYRLCISIGTAYMN
jgi:benzodiazapine receptor